MLLALHVALLAVSSATDAQHTVIATLLEQHNPTKSADPAFIPSLLAKYEGAEAVLIEAIRQKYDAQLTGVPPGARPTDNPEPQVFTADVEWCEVLEGALDAEQFLEPLGVRDFVERYWGQVRKAPSWLRSWANFSSL